MTTAAAGRPEGPGRGTRDRGLAGLRRQTVEFGPAGVLFLAVVFVWEVSLTLAGVQQFLLPRPTVIVGSLIDEWPILQRGVLYTGFEAFAGLVLGTSLGVGAAFATARWATAREALMPIAIGASAIPILALAPITSAWFSAESPLSRIAIVTLMVFFPVMINTVRGLTSVEPEALELMRSYAADDAVVLRKVRIPHALPFFFTGLRIAATLAVIGAVIGEYFGGPRYALGIYITSEAYVFRYPHAWAGILLSCLLGILFYVAIIVLERLAMPWQTAQHRRDS